MGAACQGRRAADVDGVRVDILYRDVDVVAHWTPEAEAGRFERDHVEGYLAGMATYVLAGELALGRVLAGTLPRPDFPPVLRTTAPERWFSSAIFSLDNASTFLARGDRPGAMGLAIKGLVAAAQGILAQRGEWALNEKRIIERAGLTPGAAALLSQRDDPVRAVQSCRATVAARADLPG